MVDISNLEPAVTYRQLLPFNVNMRSQTRHTDMICSYGLAQFTETLADKNGFRFQFSTLTKTPGLGLNVVSHGHDGTKTAGVAAVSR